LRRWRMKAGIAIARLFLTKAHMHTERDNDVEIYAPDHIFFCRDRVGRCAEP